MVQKNDTLLLSTRYLELRSVEIFSFFCYHMVFPTTNSIQVLQDHFPPLRDWVMMGCYLPSFIILPNGLQFFMHHAGIFCPSWERAKESLTTHLMLTHFLGDKIFVQKNKYIYSHHSLDWSRTTVLNLYIFSEAQSIKNDYDIMTIDIT